VHTPDDQPSTKEYFKLIARNASHAAGRGKACLQLWQQARKEAALGTVLNMVRRQHERRKRLAIRGRKSMQRKVRVLRQLLADLLEGALLAKDAPAWTKLR